MQNSENMIRVEELAGEILKIARSSLFVNFRFLQRAISHIEMTTSESSAIHFACDGARLYYDPAFILARYKEHPNIITRSLLHSILHCIYHHEWTGTDIDRDLWDLACDVAVENTINEMHGSCADIPTRIQQSTLIAVLKKELKLLNAENIYRFLKEKGITTEEAHKERENFRMDQHSLWMNYGEDAETDENIIRVWKEISKRMEMELETMQSGQDTLCQNLHKLNRTRRSYAQFLKRFGRHGEVIRMSEDEFDNNYYAYGMELYGNIPLIEHLEYREQKHIRTFVVAIDTSDSVQGETVQKFIQKTYDIIRSQESFDTRMRLHIIQCDDRIREDALITTDDEFERYMNSMQIIGLGKTDFRPVFAYIDEQIRERKMTDLAGLLYFTDGNGIYPTKKPPYDVAFIFHTDEVYPPEVPQWSMRLILEEDFA